MVPYGAHTDGRNARIKMEMRTKGKQYVRDPLPNENVCGLAELLRCRDKI